MKNLKMSEIDELNADSSMQEDGIAGETLTPTKSRFGRSHKPKMLGDFVSTDKKVSMLLKVSPVNQIKFYKDPARNRDPNKKRSPKKDRTSRKSLLRESDGEHAQNATSPPPVTTPRTYAPASASTIQVKVEPEEMEPDPGCEWMVGDLVWGRVGNHPFWPCIINRDPELGIFTRIRMFSKSLVPHRRLHVQFFGDNGRRSWLSSTSVMNYTGRAAFEDLSNMILSGMKRKEPKQVSALVVKPNLKPVWESAVAEAESLLNSSREDRVLHFKRLLPNALNKLNMKTDGVENEHSPPQREKRRYRKRKVEQNDEDPDYGVAKKQIKLDPETPSETNVIEKSSFPSIVIKRGRGRPRKTLDAIDKSKLMKQEPANDSSPASKMTRRSESVTKMEIETAESSEQVQPKQIQSKKHLSPRSRARSAYVLLEQSDMSMEEIPKKKFRTPIAKSTDQTKAKYKKAKLGPDFNNFSSRNFNKVSGEHPEMGPKEVGDMLEKMWNDLDGIQKSRYRPKVNCKDKDDEEVEESAAWDLEDTDEKTSTSEISESPLTVPPPRSNANRSKVSLFNGAFQGKVCQVCEKPGNTVRCKGPCFGTYHVECAANPRDFSARISEIFQSVAASSPSAVNKKRKRDGRKRKSETSIKSEMNSEDSVSNEMESDADSSVKAENETRLRQASKSARGKLVEAVEAIDCGESMVSEPKSDKKKAQRGKGSNKESCDSSEEAEPDSQMADFRCAACQEPRLQPCFVCGRDEFNGENTRQRCHASQCGRVYHLECLKAWPQVSWVRGGGNNGRKGDDAKKKPAFTCPQHACHTCISDNPGVVKDRFANDRLVKCLRCPTSYHYGNHCLPAGTEVITTRQIICPQHYKIHKKGLHHVNAAWCFICASGGSLICCDLCPTAFHADCLKISPPEGGYICEDCETGRFPLYGEIVWVKLGAYRWWPAQIVFPHQIPENIQNLVHSRGEFAVKFFGSHDFYWVNRGRVFLYQEGDSGGRCRSKISGTDQVFLRAVQEASEACMRLKNEKAFRDASNRSGLKPPSYIRIKTNKPVGQVRAMEANISNLTPCECDPNSQNPCALDTDCLNRILMVECNPLICPAGQRCNNQQFEKRQYPPLMPYRTDGRGWGLKTLVDLKKGEFVIEYVGEMINEVEYQRRLQKMHEANEDNYYFLTIDKDRMLDAGPKGNVARFMNHSCQPNCETQKWTVNGDTRVGLFALHDITAESELVFNYNLESTGTEKKQCMCGAPNCSGFIGVKANKNGNGNNAVEDSALQPKKPSRRSRSVKQPAKLSDELCFLCEKGGELLLCDGKSCTKAYHLACLNRNKKPPVGYWLCPWHQCNVCGKGKAFRCNLCINSYCPTHAEGNIRLEESIGYVCSVHDNKADRNKTEDKAKTAVADPPSIKDEETNASDAVPDIVAGVDLVSPQEGSQLVSEICPDNSSATSQKPNENVDRAVSNVKMLRSYRPITRRSRSNSDIDLSSNHKEIEKCLSINKNIRRPASVDSVPVKEVEVPLKETLLRNMVSKKRRSLKNPSPSVEESNISNNTDDDQSNTPINDINCSETSKESREEMSADDGLDPLGPSFPEKCAQSTEKSVSLNGSSDEDHEIIKTNATSKEIDNQFSSSNSPLKVEEKENDKNKLDGEISLEVDEEKSVDSHLKEDNSNGGVVDEVKEDSCKTDAESEIIPNHKDEIMNGEDDTNGAVVNEMKEDSCKTDAENEVISNHKDEIMNGEDDTNGGVVNEMKEANCKTDAENEVISNHKDEIMNGEDDTNGGVVDEVKEDSCKTDAENEVISNHKDEIMNGEDDTNGGVVDEVKEDSCKTDAKSEVISNHKDEIMNGVESIQELSADSETNPENRVTSYHNEEISKGEVVEVKNDNSDINSENPVTQVDVVRKPDEENEVTLSNTVDLQETNEKPEILCSSNTLQEVPKACESDKVNDVLECAEESSSISENIEDNTANLHASNISPANEPTVNNEDRKVENIPVEESSKDLDVTTNGHVESSEIPVLSQEEENIDEKIERVKVHTESINSSSGTKLNESCEEIIEDHCKTRMDTEEDRISGINGEAKILGTNDEHTVNNLEGDSREQIRTENQDSLVT